MNLVRTCIEKPVIAIVLSLMLLVLGVVGFQRLEIRYLPNLVIPIVQIRTSYTGAPSSLMESNVTNLLENSLAGIDGIDYMTSYSNPGSSNITIQFKLGGDFSNQVNEVRDKISSAMGNTSWVANAQTPVLTIGTNANNLMSVSFDDPQKDAEYIRGYVNDNVVPQLQAITGVGSISLQGSSNYAMRIWLDANKMASFGITATDIQTALKANNIDIGAGSIYSGARNYSVVSNTKLQNPTDFGNVILSRTDQGTVRLADVATIKFAPPNFDEMPVTINGKPAVYINVNPVQGANPMSLSKAVKAELAKLQSNMPEGMKENVIYEQTKFIASSIHDTVKAILEAIILVIVVVCLFLGSIRSSLMPIITIPVSLIGVCFLIYILGFSINTMSLLAIVLAIGLVVDDAIVMLENIYRYVEDGLSPLDAALVGAKEITGAIIAISLTLFAVYAPIGMVQGFTAKLFQQFAFTLAGAVILSGFVALTLTPMMCSKILTSDLHSAKFVVLVDSVFKSLTNGYKQVLRFFLLRRILVWLILIITLIVGVFFYSRLQSEFLPQEDTGEVAVSMVAPTGSSLEYSEKYAAQIQQIINKIPSIEYIVTQGSGGGARFDFTLVLKPWQQRKQTPGNIINELNAQFANIPGVTASAYIPDVIDYGTQGSDLDINLQTSGNYEDMITPANKLVSALRKYPGVTAVDSDLKFDAQQYSISVNRDLAAELGVSLTDISNTLSIMMAGNHVTDIQSGKRSYQVLMQMPKQDLTNISALDKLYVKSTKGASPAMIPLSNIVTMTPIVGQASLHHYNRFRSGTVSARLASGYTEGEVINYVNKILPTITNSKVSASYSGKAREFIDSQGSIGTIMLMALLFIYLVLSIQFTSFIDPLIILFVVPFTMIGALAALYFVGGTFNMYSQIGLVTLIGMISKHGILITQFINQLRERGQEQLSAIIEGAAIRLRPILMTTAAMVFGTLPLALSSGPGSIGRSQIGWVIVGGLVLGTFFSLIVVPVAYSYLGAFKKIVPTVVVDDK